MVTEKKSQYIFTLKNNNCSFFIRKLQKCNVKFPDRIGKYLQSVIMDEQKRFHNIAKLASNAEKMFNYGLAERLWRKAGLVSSDIRNIEWASRRLAFCKIMNLKKHKC
ncbi:ANR family transcriptional regulator [Escherichia coli]|uniref:ANR family transcriptional regulator n=1 Tax=Escherichia coli TaxID=562 RepID=UPI000E1FF43B